ncbi:type VI secretion system baseplate subunit TssF [Pseudomonas aeruginosa]
MLDRRPHLARQLAPVLGAQALHGGPVGEPVGEDAAARIRNGLEIRLRLDPQHFVGASGVLFSAVLAQFFSLYATANRFVRTVLVEADKEVNTWQPQAWSPLAL